MSSFALAGSRVKQLGSPVYEFTLGATASAGASTLTLNRPVGAIVAGRDLLLVIDPWNVNCEVRQCAGLSGATVTLQSALTFTHQATVTAYLVADDHLSAHLWGTVANNSADDWAALQAGINQTQLNACWLTGGGVAYVTKQPLFGSTGTRLRTIHRVRADAAFAPADTTNAMFMSCQGNWLTFTATAADDTITTSSAHGMVANQKFAINAPQAQTLPGGLVAGRVYFVKTAPTSTTLTCSATAGGATIDLTANGSGIIYTSINALERVFFDEVYLSGNSVAGLNGASLYLQQPAETRSLRIDGCAVALIVAGQISNHYNLELGAITGGVGLKLAGSGHNFYGTNITCPAGSGDGIQIGTGLDTSAIDCNFYGLWTEQALNHIRWVSTGLGIGIYGWAPSFGAAQVGIQIDAAVAAVNRGYVVVGARFSASGNVVLNDDTIVSNVLASRLPQQTLAMLRQEAGGGRPILYELSGTASLNYGSIAASATSAALTITVTGATVGDVVEVSTADALEAGLVVANKWVSAVNTVSITLANVTLIAIDPAAHTFNVTVKGLG